MSRTMIGELVDLYNREIYPAEITIENGVIIDIKRVDKIKVSSGYILPGFVDAHIHIESSMLTPSAFAAEAVDPRDRAADRSVAQYRDQASGCEHYRAQIRDAGAAKQA